MAFITAKNSKENLQAHMKTSTNHSFISDEPVDLGGNNEGPTAGELLASSLAACTAITLRMYVNHKKLTTIEDINVDIDLDYDKDAGKITFKRKIKIDGEYDESILKRFHHVANACPVHKMLSGEIVTETEFI